MIFVSVSDPMQSGPQWRNAQQDVGAGLEGIKQAGGDPWVYSQTHD